MSPHALNGFKHIGKFATCIIAATSSDRMRCLPAMVPSRDGWQNAVDEFNPNRGRGKGRRHRVA